MHAGCNRNFPLASPFLAGSQNSSWHPALFPPQVLAFKELHGVTPYIQKGEKTMATIGKFTKTGEEFAGTIKTLLLTAKVKIVPVRNKKAKSPDYTVSTQDDILLGFARMKVSANDNKYLLIKLDDPALPAPIFCVLLKRDDGSYNLNWNRPYVQTDTEADASDGASDDF
jgi:uncharacterized protein (DUF736 family)